MRVIVTGGAGFVGSHVCVALGLAGHEAVIVDSFANAKDDVPDRIAEIVGSRPTVHRVDVRDAAALDAVLSQSPGDSVVHCAALKAVGDSVARPLEYYDNNVVGTITLLKVMEGHGLRSLVFSSSATVYGDPVTVPVTEDHPVGDATNPYGWTKVMMEQVMIDMHRADPRWSISLLRYFNPVGAHPSGIVGEDPAGIPTNLMPYVAQVAAGNLERLEVFGGDYPTPDGTGVRDYVHVADLAEGHVAALEAMDEARLSIHNLGTGRGASVLELVAAFERATGVSVPHRIVDRRPGDVAATWADVSKAKAELNWEASRSLEDMCADMWRWQQSGRAG